MMQNDQVMSGGDSKEYDRSEDDSSAENGRTRQPEQRRDGEQRKMTTNMSS